MARLSFSTRVIAWFQTQGRRGLPWQSKPTPYRVWISEIMLQQTQVATVIPYFQRFMQTFPTLEHLAKASLDDVFQQWAGLGYYRRAKHLHQSAVLIQKHYHGIFPSAYEDILALPGIGRSTAGAILSMSMQQSYPILDGNVKRVLARHFGIQGWPGDPAVSKQLWALSAANTPTKDVHHYTQGMMDLGATLCTARNPACERCPIAGSCKAKALGIISTMPAKRPKKVIPVQATRMLIFLHPATQKVLLEKRETKGIWGGLWSLVECPLRTNLSVWCHEQFKILVKKPRKLEAFRHTFTHFHLDIHPVICEVHIKPIPRLKAPYQWHALEDLPKLGLPAPVKRLLSADRLLPSMVE